MYVVLVDTFIYTTGDADWALSKFKELCPYHRDVLVVRFGGGMRSARVAEKYGFEEPHIWYDRAWKERLGG